MKNKLMLTGCELMASVCVNGENLDRDEVLSFIEGFKDEHEPLAGGILGFYNAFEAVEIMVTKYNDSIYTVEGIHLPNVVDCYSINEIKDDFDMDKWVLKVVQKYTVDTELEPYFIDINKGVILSKENSDYFTLAS